MGVHERARGKKVGDRHHGGSLRVSGSIEHVTSLTEVLDQSPAPRRNESLRLWCRLGGRGEQGSLALTESPSGTKRDMEGRRDRVGPWGDLSGCRGLGQEGKGRRGSGLHSCDPGRQVISPRSLGPGLRIEEESGLSSWF